MVASVLGGFIAARPLMVWRWFWGHNLDINQNACNKFGMVIDDEQLKLVHINQVSENPSWHQVLTSYNSVVDRDICTEFGTWWKTMVMIMFKIATKNKFNIVAAFILDLVSVAYFSHQSILLHQIWYNCRKYNME